MSLRQKITNQKNWKLKMRIALLVPLLLVMVYIVAQTGAIDMSSITGFATLSAKGNDKNNNDKVPAGLSNEIQNENDYSIFAADSSDKENDKDKDRSEKDKDESVPDNDNNNSEGENDDAQDQEPPVLGGGGGSSGGTVDEEPVITPPEENTTDEDNSEPSHSSTSAMPVRPVNFWGRLYINDTVADIGESIIARINNTQYQTTTVEDGYYTITIPGTDGVSVELLYNNTVIENASWVSGAVKELDLYF